MRASLCVRTAKSALSADPTKTHVHDRSPLWKKVREALVVNPDIHTGSPLVLEHRWPQPASRPETFTVPASKASDVADNAYFKRDFRRMYPKTSVVTQEELATLLIAQGGFTSCVHSLRATKLLGERMRDLSAMERRAETLFVTLCSLPAPPTASSSEKALTADSPAPSLAAVCLVSDLLRIARAPL
ncbi:hypothetical protein P7C70_g4061, partial [Phenoliferia sp. Uapishka_3]